MRKFYREWQISQKSFAKFVDARFVKILTR